MQRRAVLPGQKPAGVDPMMRHQRGQDARRRVPGLIGHDLDEVSLGDPELEGGLVNLRRAITPNQRPDSSRKLRGGQTRVHEYDALRRQIEKIASKNPAATYPPNRVFRDWPAVRS
jgi:hypothetical protein